MSTLEIVCTFVMDMKSNRWGAMFLWSWYSFTCVVVGQLCSCPLFHLVFFLFKCCWPWKSIFVNISIINQLIFLYMFSYDIYVKTYYFTFLIICLDCLHLFVHHSSSFSFMLQTSIPSRNSFGSYLFVIVSFFLNFIVIEFT